MRHDTKLEFSHWASLALLIGLLGCAVGILYVSFWSVANIDDIERHMMPAPEAPFDAQGHGNSEVSDALDKIWAGTVWIGREVAPGATRYVGSGWVIGNKDGISYISTCAHVATYKPELPLKVAYLGRSGVWSELSAKEIKRLDTRLHGDVAIISVEAALPSLKCATNQATFTVNDEVFIAGVQYMAPPAIIATGVISAVDRKQHEFQLKGWAWHGFSGGPVVLRKTGEVIGYVAWSVKGYANSAMRSDCADLTHLMKLLKACGLESIILE